MIQPQVSQYQVTAGAATSAQAVTVGPVPLLDGWYKTVVIVKETTAATTARITTASVVKISQLGYAPVSLAYNAVLDPRTGVSVDLSGLVGVDLATTERRGVISRSMQDANANEFAIQDYPLAGLGPAALSITLQNSVATATYQITVVQFSMPVTLSQGGVRPLPAVVA